MYKLWQFALELVRNLEYDPLKLKNYHPLQQAYAAGQRDLDGLLCDAVLQVEPVRRHGVDVEADVPRPSLHNQAVGGYAAHDEHVLGRDVQLHGFAPTQDDLEVALQLGVSVDLQQDLASQVLEGLGDGELAEEVGAADQPLLWRVLHAG